ncbi:MAG: alcohol dehydrogenase, partial [Gammaproteobacteria bacterium]|nr:alcohol dehydrogenase [Gammaproteobacteria bacterium]
MQALETLRAGNIVVSDLITHRFPLEDIGRGFRMAAEGRDCLKVIITPNGQSPPG